MVETSGDVGGAFCEAKRDRQWSRGGYGAAVFRATSEVPPPRAAWA